MQAKPYAPALEGARALSCHHFPGRGSARCCRNIQLLSGLQGQSPKSMALVCNMNGHIAFLSVHPEHIQKVHALKEQKKRTHPWEIVPRGAACNARCCPWLTLRDGGAGSARPGPAAPRGGPLPAERGVPACPVPSAAEVATRFPSPQPALFPSLSLIIQCQGGLCNI